MKVINYITFLKVIILFISINRFIRYNNNNNNSTTFLILGDLINEEQVLKWLIEQKTTATIEEVTDEILKTLIAEHEYVLVYFSKFKHRYSTRLCVIY